MPGTPNMLSPAHSRLGSMSDVKSNNDDLKSNAKMFGEWYNNYLVISIK